MDIVNLYKFVFLDLNVGVKPCPSLKCWSHTDEDGCMLKENVAGCSDLVCTESSMDITVRLRVLLTLRGTESFARLMGVVSSGKVWLKKMYITKSTKKKVGRGLAALSGV